MPKQQPTTDEKLDIIIHYLHRMDKRDKLRMVGGFFRSLISLIPIIIFVWSTWYFIAHGDEIMKTITKYAAQSAAEMTQSQGGQMMEQIKLMFPNEGQ